MQIEYGEFLELIRNALLEDNKNDFVGMALLKGSINLYNKEEWNGIIGVGLNQMAHNIIISLKEQFKEKLIIIEDGEEIMQEYNK